jgi:hypothetical protein
VVDVPETLADAFDQGAHVGAVAFLPELVASLVAMEGHPWAEYGKAGKPLSVNGLARMLSNDGISPGSVRIGEETPKGYKREQFEDAFARYLPPPPNPTATPPQPSDFCGFPTKSQPPQGDGCVDSEIDQEPRVSAACGGVADEKLEKPQKSERVRVRL